VADWRDGRYPDDRYPAIGEEILVVEDRALSLTARPKRRKPGVTARQAKGAWARQGRGPWARQGRGPKPAEALRHGQ
jgi:hypothetical protein